MIVAIADALGPQVRPHRIAVGQRVSLTLPEETDFVGKLVSIMPERNRQSDYRIMVSRSHHRPRADTYLFDIPEPIPSISIPLQEGGTESALPLNQIVHDLYGRAGYDLAVDYQQPPEPPLRDETATWVQQHLA